jgi:hypothetical protein
MVQFRRNQLGQGTGENENTSESKRSLLTGGICYLVTLNNVLLWPFLCNLSSRTPHMSSLVVICLSSYYRFVLLTHYELVPSWVSVAYVQTISSDVARASPQLVSLLVSHVCHRSGPDLFLCGHKSIVACASPLCLVVGHVTS